MATLEDAAADLVVKLRGLDSEIEESERELVDLRARIEHVEEEVEREWTTFEEALGSFLEKVAAHETRLDSAEQSAGEALRDAHRVVGQQGAEARAKLGVGRGLLHTLAGQATAQQSELESLARTQGDEPAGALAGQADEEATRVAVVVDEVGRFLDGKVIPGIAQDASDVREQCEQLKEIADLAASGLQQAFEEWESKAGLVEDLVGGQGFTASHAHAHEVVTRALEECRKQSEATVLNYEELVGAVEDILEVLSVEMQDVGPALQRAAEDLVQELDGTVSTAEATVSTLGGLRSLLASYSLTEA